MAFKTFWQLFSRLIMVKQTLFALPFAFIGVLFALGIETGTGTGAGTKSGTLGSFSLWIWVTLSLVAARTCGMSFNRVIDARIDKKNPRTSNRVLPAGELSHAAVWIMAVISSFLLIFASYMLNDLCFKLSFLAVFLLLTYSFFKRFSSSSHFYLGVVEAVAPIGGYLAVTGEFGFMPFILGFIILFWIAGLDIVYAFQDIEFDRKENLHSLPVKIGKKNALAWSLICYGLSAAAIVLAGTISGRGLFFWIAFTFIIMLFSYQQILARENNINESIKEIFHVNMYISPALFFGTLLDSLNNYL
jgi:4-hydroxybenzoate polyprenyltransferase